MLTDNQYVIESFEKNFGRCKKKRMVLYGKGPYTKAILQVAKDYNIIGIMDRDIKKGFIYGLQVLSYEEVLEQNVDIIIVVSRPNSIKEVYDRIHVFCSLNYIQLYGIGGENLLCQYNSEEDRDENVIFAFQKHFESLKNQRIVLYGKGPRTRIILEAFPDYNIIGIMDKTLKEGSCYNRKVLSYEDVLEQEADIIISVTREWTTRYVYNRIGTFCQYNHILLYDIEGNNLFETMGPIREEIEPDPYFDISEDKLRAEIENHEVISFDIFDTLVMRKTLLPTDVFYIVEDKARKEGIIIPSFREFRRIAEADIIQSNPNIYDIYMRLQAITGIQDKIRNRLLELELEVEKSVLVPREKMVEMMQYAIKLGKRVCLISDMYLSERLLKRFLTDLNIVGYEKLYVSCDYNVAKYNGIYEIFKRQICGGSYLHIGDNAVADGICAGNYGIDSFCIKKSLDMLDISSYGIIRSYLTNINERSMVGMFIAKAFNNPFSLFHTAGRLEVDQIYDLGYLYISGVVTDFVLWLIKKLKVGMYDQVLFAARDGYLIDKLYRYYQECCRERGMPEALYYQISRRLIINCGMETEEDICWLCSLPYAYDPDQMLMDKFGFCKEELLSYSKEKYPDAISYGIANKELIFRKSAEIRKDYQNYIHNIGIKDGMRYAFIDLVSSGTCQYFMEKIGLFDFDSYYLCFYVGGDEKRKKMDHSERYFWNNIKDNNYIDYTEESWTHREYWFLETILTSDQPSLIGISKEGNLVLDSEHRTELELKFVHEMHKAIETYFKDFVSNLYIDTVDMSSNVPDRLYSFKNLKYTYEHCEILDQFSLFEDLGQGRLAIMRH